MNVQVEVKWRTWKNIADSIMTHTWVLDEYIHFAFLYMTNHTFPILPIKHLVNQDGEPTTPQKLATGIKPSV